MVFFGEADFEEFFLGKREEDMQRHAEAEGGAAGDDVAPGGQGTDQLQFATVRFHLRFELGERRFDAGGSCDQVGVRSTRLFRRSMA